MSEGQTPPETSEGQATPGSSEGQTPPGTGEGQPSSRPGEGQPSSRPGEGQPSSRPGEGRAPSGTSDGRSPSGLAHDAATAPGGYPTYRPRLPLTWWQRNPRYTLYMLREASSIFIALWSVLFLAQLSRLRRGEDAYERFVEAQRSPLWILLNLITFVLAVLHSVTWFQLTGVVMSGMAQKVRLGRLRLTAQMLTAGAFASWAGASLVVLLALLFGGRKE